MNDSGIYIHVAVAGSGKTSSLVRRARDLLIEGGDDPTNVVLVSTYTREAASELKSRIVESNLGDHVGRRLVVGTFHSIATQVTNSLRKQAGQSPLRVHGTGRGAYRLGEALTDIVQRVPGILEEMKAAGCPTDLGVIARRIVALREILPVEARATPDLLRAYLRTDEAAAFFSLAINHWAELCEDAPISDMTRIIPAAVRSLRATGPDGFSWCPRHVLVDESQDLSPVMVEFIDALSRRAQSLYLVGDPDQSIYRWRGGGEIPFTQIPDCLQMAGHLRHQVVVLPALNQSRRCPDVVAAASSSLLDHTKTGPSAAIVGHDSGRISAGWFDADGDEAATVARLISGISIGNFRNVAVLARTHQSVAPVFFKLISQQVPVRMMRADDPAMKHILDRISVFLRAALSPQDVDAAKAILRMRAENPGLGVASVRKVEAHLTATESTYRTLLAITPAPGLRKPQVEVVHQVGKLLQKSVEELRKRKDVGSWLTWLVRTSPGAVTPPETDPDDVTRVLAFADQLAAATGTAQRFLDITADTGGGDRVSVGTYHAAKGREWADVFLVALTRQNIEGMRERMTERLFAEGVLDGGEDGERRLLHVAITRAARQVVMTWSGGADAVSRYVVETDIDIPTRPGIEYRPTQQAHRLRQRADTAQQLSLF